MVPPRCMSVMEQGTQCMVVIVEIAAHTARWWSRGHLTITTPVTTFRYFTLRERCTLARPYSPCRDVTAPLMQSSNDRAVAPRRAAPRVPSRSERTSSKRYLFLNLTIYICSSTCSPAHKAKARIHIRMRKRYSCRARHAISVLFHVYPSLGF